MVLERLSNGNLTLRGRVAERIRDAILNGTLKEGKRVDRELASQLGASVSVIREAIIQVESEGFIKKWPNSSTYVTKLCPAETEKMLDCRTVIEGFAVEQAAKRATPEDNLNPVYGKSPQSTRRSRRIGSGSRRLKTTETVPSQPGQTWRLSVLADSGMEECLASRPARAAWEPAPLSELCSFAYNYRV